MVDWWLIVLLVIVSLLCVGLGIYLLFFFISEEEDGDAHVAKIIIVFGFVVTTGVVLLLPFDVASSIDPTINYQKTGLLLNLQLLWQIVMWILISMSLIVVPFTIYFYEAYDPDKVSVSKQIGHAVIFTLVIILLFSVFCGVCYSFIGIAEVPVHLYKAKPQIVIDINDVNYTDNSILFYVNIKVSIFTYCVGILHCIGWLFFLIYGGVGLMAVPIDLFFGFVRRPKAINPSIFLQNMAIIAAKADALLGMALDLQKTTRGTISNSRQRMIKILFKETYILETQQEQLIWAYTRVGGSPFIVYGRLLLGFISLVITILWVLHIFIYNIFALSPFLNDILTKLNSIFTLFSVITYSIFTFYLLWITFEGQMRLGMRFIFFQIYPLKSHDTTINSLLFNIWLFLLASIAIVGFTARSFSEYTAWTKINILMNTYILNLKYFGYFIKWAQIFFLGISLLSLPWLILCPVFKKKNKKNDTFLLSLDK